MELWIYGIKNSETDLVNSIQNITHDYIVMKSIIMGSVEYRVFVVDNSELQKLINSINKIEGVMYTPERFTGMGLAINHDGTPWAEIGYANKTDSPANITIPPGHTKTIFNVNTKTVTMFPSHFEFRCPGGNYSDVDFKIYDNGVLKGVETIADVASNYTQDNEWYVYKYKDPVGLVYYFVLKHDVITSLYEVKIHNHTGSAAYVEKILYSLRLL